MDGANEMRQVFEGAGLSAPPVPPDLESRVRRRGEWLYATRGIDPMAMYMFRDHVTEAMSRRVGDYMAVCHAGHGVNSYCVNYHLVWGPVAIFAQTGWGGVYMDRERSAADVRDLLAQCGDVLAAATEARPALERSGRRLVVAESRIRGRATYGWLDEDGRYTTVEDTRKALSDAAALLRSPA
ncbi:hypothetical protein [Actinomadura sp. RB99]|uniref:hypothetical protein n=1 Tax=Actinomadura sp. RB99 TaxID=2691577 RepID=UPI001686E2B5|nr:hypothetical protein [Actinomadura sp. RB99]